VNDNRDMYILLFDLPRILPPSMMAMVCSMSSTAIRVDGRTMCCSMHLASGEWVKRSTTSASFLRLLWVLLLPVP